ncbi:hypothetical protein GYH30_036831 [Glycine max]|nr:hypothetical protein GYH30_036831 [Glycine max]
MDEEAESVPHPQSPKLGFPLPSSAAADGNLITGLSTIMAASIQDAKNRISQIERVFCSKLHPLFKSDIALKRRRIQYLEELLHSKESALRDS